MKTNIDHLKASDLTCVRGEETIFSRLDVSAQATEVVQLKGDNGSGKTSLLRLLCGIAQPDAGTVRWNGIDIHHDPEAFRRNVAYVGHRRGVCEDLSFLSPFEPVNPRLRVPYLRHRANRVAHARFWRHDRGPRPTIIAIHGFGADEFWLNEWLFSIRWFYEKLGCDVLLFTLPFHGPRQTRFSPFSGFGFFAGCSFSSATR